MAVTCDANALSTASKCFQGISAQLQQAIRIRLLCGYINGETMTCDVNVLAIASACYLGLSADQMEAVQTYLVCQIASGAAGGVFNGHGAPTITPSGTAGLYTDLDTGILYSWNGSVWI